MKKIKADFKKESIQDLKSYFNVSEKIESTLVNELAKEIDKNILRSMGFEPDKNKRRMKRIAKIFNI
jgi:hypothetical protein